ncbi:aromatase/cyclase [Saccharomonospora saliphila]|uniref:aromatase/cyclase n=1 Tax=Saccharomonospora saliphila TaxID=369829 RepID=UPI0003786A62|nr:SRPBCC family protein [Saccharomonospora saliphila]
MSQSRTLESEHETTVRAPAREVYRLLTDLTSWPRVFPTTLHLEPLGHDGDQHRVGMWTLSDEQVHTWVALRRYHPERLRMDYRHETPRPPVTDMGGSWQVEALDADRSRVRLSHDVHTSAGDAETLRWIEDTLHDFSTAELEALRVAAEREAAEPDTLLVLTDSVEIACAREEVYDFLFDARRWPERMPHISRASVTENGPDAHILETDMVVESGRTLTTRTARLGLPHHAIVFTHLRLPPIGLAHHVRWLLDSRAGGVGVTAEQTVVVNAAGITDTLGPGVSLSDARGFIRRELGGNARSILEQAKSHCESSPAGSSSGKGADRA